MKINQRFRTRKDLHGHVVYFEDEGPFEMPEIQAFLIEQLREEKTRNELLESARTHCPDHDNEVEVSDVIQTLKQLHLLS